MEVTVSRKTHFNAAHRLHNPEWSEERNKEVFGLCNNANFHGHNYNLIVKVTGPVDSKTGYVIDLKVLNDIISKEILERYDHKNLNLDVEDFKSLNPTAENIAITIYERLILHIPKHLKLRVVLYETERNFVEFPAV